MVTDKGGSMFSCFCFVFLNYIAQLTTKKNETDINLREKDKEILSFILWCFLKRTKKTVIIINSSTR